MTTIDVLPAQPATGQARRLPNWHEPHDHTACAVIIGRRFPQLETSVAAEVDELQCEVCGLTYEVVMGEYPTEPTDWFPRWPSGSFLDFVVFLADRVGACSLCCHRVSCRSRRPDCRCRCHRLTARPSR